MNRHLASIAGRLSLRAPQREALNILHRLTELSPPRKGGDVAAKLAAFAAEYPTVTDFEREFPSLCFALATGVGKTRLMGAFIGYLHLAHGLNHFFVLAPNLTIYNKLIMDFTPNTPKYVFKGIGEFVTNVPLIITGDNYDSTPRGTESQLFPNTVCVNIFNISKINSEVRGGRSPRIKRLAEVLGESYFDYLAGLPDLVLIMDESHRYRADAGVKSLNELKPVLGLELTATPYVESSRGPVRFRNVIQDYRLAQAMADGFVKEPAVVTRKDFDPTGMSASAIEQMKLEDGIRMHESTKVELATYAQQSGRPLVKPFMLVIARDTTHAGELLKHIDSDEFFSGRYRGKAIQVDSSKTGAAEDEMVARLLKVEDPDEPTEIVIHVNMLKEGWDVTNLYTIVPLRAANARVLIEQSIGRGLRLPYGKRTGVPAVDRLNIVAHDRFQEIVDEANRPDSVVHMKQILLTPEELQKRPVTMTAPPVLDQVLGLVAADYASATGGSPAHQPAVFSSPEEVKVARLVLDQIRVLARDPSAAPTLAALSEPAIQKRIYEQVQRVMSPTQLTIAGLESSVDLAQVILATTLQATSLVISIPRVVVVPKGESRTAFTPFKLDLSSVRYPKVSNELLARHLRTAQTDVIAMGPKAPSERRDEDHLVRFLMDQNDVDYDAHSDLLYDLAGQVVVHLRSYLSADEAREVLRCYERELGELVHQQMLAHSADTAEEFTVRVTGGYTLPSTPAFTADAGSVALDFLREPPDKSKIASETFCGFGRCLYTLQKFDSDTERRLAVILDRDALKWFRPSSKDIAISYRLGQDVRGYEPDFIAEDTDGCYVLETKAKDELSDPAVLAKQAAAVEWCKHATEFGAKHGGKAWQYALIPHDMVAENMTLKGLVGRFAK